MRSRQRLTSHAAYPALAVCLVMGCADHQSSTATATGGSGVSTGGAAPGGGTGSAAPGGGTGSSTGGAAIGGGGPSAGGHTATGGANSGGSSTGGTASGGVPTSGGSATGGATGGNSSGTGGAATGGSGGGTASGGAGGSGAAEIGGAGASSGGSAAGETGAGGGAAEGATIVPDPSWACGMPDGVPPPATGALALSMTLELGEIHDVGATQYGDRRLLDVTGGSVTGNGIEGSVLTGGLDLELRLSNGALEVEQINILRTNDGKYIYLHSCGFAPAPDPLARVVLDFEAPNDSAAAFLNQGTYVATRVVDEAAGTMVLDVYDISGVAVAEPKIQLQDPDDLPDQPTECNQVAGTQDSEVFTENVALGAAFSTGASKRGTRNIIPITGGTVTGRFTGSILPGGADYQLATSGGSTTLDARYTLVDDNGVYVIVRNCGPMTGLVPWFETPVDGPYAFLNENQYVSSPPGGGVGGGVSITFYTVK